jgi:hypothetical protein
VSVTVEITLNGISVPVTLNDDALTAIADAVAARHEPEPGYLDTKQAAAHLGLTIPALEKLKQRGRLPYTQEAPGHKVWFARRDLDAWQPNHQPEPKETTR